MQWPEHPTCHTQDRSPFATSEYMVWREPGYGAEKRPDDPYARNFRTCGYCGSIHPEDLLAVLLAGAQLQGSDRKYGWPHKFYVEGIPNPNAGTIIPVYAYCGMRELLGPSAERYTYPDGFASWREKINEYPAPPTQGAKWYNEHLLDQGYDTEALVFLLAALEQHSWITFRIENGLLVYRAPSAGFQR